MKRFAKVFLVGCIAAVASGCSNDTTSGSDAGPAGTDASSTTLCGGISCPANAMCIADQCVSCGCGAKTCGNDACGNSCGTCAAPQVCNTSAGTCGCETGKTACGSTCCDNATQECNPGTSTCVAKCGTGQTRCGSTCCESTQFCSDAATSTCETLATCDADQTVCGKNCCTATQSCQNLGCVECGSVEKACGSTCCGAAQTCQSGACACVAAGETACGSACCDSTQFCSNAATSTCATLAICDTGTATVVCGDKCCDNATQFCDAGTCVNQPSCTSKQTKCGNVCCNNATQFCDQTICKALAEPGCDVNTTYSSVTINGIVDPGSNGGPYYFEGVLPSSDRSFDVLTMDFYDGFGAFESGIAPGSYIIAGDDLDPDNCGLCIKIYANIDDQGNENSVFMAMGGSVTISELTTGLVGTLSNVTFQQIQSDGTPEPGGCASEIVAGAFNGGFFCDPTTQQPCTSFGQGCYIDYDLSYWRCMYASTNAGDQGAMCASETDCVAGLWCAEDYTCQNYCSPANGDADCTSGYTCEKQTQSGSIGTCTQPPIPCDPITQQPCPSGQVCSIDWWDDEWGCMPPGPGGTGDGCAKSSDCQAGFGCSGSSDNIHYNLCTPSCQGDDDCPPEFPHCYDPMFGGVQGELGFCANY